MHLKCPQHLGWMKDDLENESERKYRSPNSYHDSSSSSTEDHRRLQEDLLAEWLQIEMEPGITDVVQPAGTNMSTYESTGMEIEAVLADWYLLEKALEAEKQLADIVTQCGGTDDDTKVKIDYIVHSASIRIKYIVATAQEDLQKLIKACGSSCNLSVTVNSEVPSLAHVAPLIESKPSFIRELWPDSDPGISADGNDRLGVNRFSSDIDFDVEDLKLYLDLSCGEEDPDEQHLIDQKATELNDSENTSTCDHGTTSNHTTESPDDVNLLDERTSSGTWIDTECRSSEEADYNLIPS